MLCPSGHRVPGGSNFCPECGLALAARRCSRCDAAIAPGAKFCAGCGAAVDGTVPRRRKEDRRQPAEQELRQITAVFCDIVSSTELSSQLDPEQFAEMVATYQERVGEVLESYGGAVDKYLGDGILMQFGWPQAHDDDAERAVLAALAIVDGLAAGETPVPLQVRIGVHTGPVLVGEMGSKGKRETMALGETMNRTAKLQGVAPPGGVVVSEATLQLVRGIFLVEDLGPQQIEGVPEAMPAFRVLQRSGVRSKLDAAGDRLTPLVSREDEMKRMSELWRGAREGKGGAVLLRGDPGIGKSRLAYELRAEVAASAHTWLEARGSSYTSRSPFRPAIALIEQALGLAPGDGDADRLEKLVNGLAQAGVSDPDGPALLAELLSIESDQLSRPEMSPDLTRRRTIEVLAKWVLALADLQPLVLLVEDLHWCDSGSLSLFEQLLVQGPAHPLLLVGTTRPELDVPWLGNPNLETIELGPLDDDEVRELLAALDPQRGLPDALLARIAGEADGVPLFAEEIGRMVLESGQASAGGGDPGLTASVDELEIPATLQDSLMARLDRLSAAKRVAQLAAVIGRDFDYPMLEEVSGLDREMLRHGLGRLVEEELIFQSGDPPEAVYTFKHALIQDAAYRSLPKRSRRPLHERAAGALERRDAAGSAEAVARHWEAAGRSDEAIEAYARAAEEAARHFSHPEAIEHLRNALTLAGEIPADESAKAREVDLLTALGSSVMAARGYADEEIADAYARARSLCAELGQGSRVGYAQVGLAIYYFNSGAVADGAELAAEALEVATRNNDDTLALLAHVQLAVPNLWQGNFEPALEHAEAACDAYDSDRHGDLAFRFGTDQGVSALCMAGCALSNLGRPDTGLVRVRAAVELARGLGNPFNVVYALAIEGGVRWIRGELDEQRGVAEEVVALSTEQGFSDFAGIGRILRGTAISTKDPDAAALDDCLRGLEQAASTGRRGSVTMFLELIARAHQAQGRSEEALGWIEGGLGLAEETGQHWWDARLLHLRGEVRSDSDSEAAEADFRRGMAISSANGDALTELQCATALARLLAAAGDDGAPERLLRGPLSNLAEGHATRAFADAATLLGEGASLAGRS